MRGRHLRPHCPKCYRTAVEVTGLRSRKTRNGDTAFKAEAYCRDCRWNWLSIHPTLLRQAKALEAGLTAAER